MIRTRRSDTNITFAPRQVETLWVAQTAAERELYREVSDFVAESVHAEDGGPGPPALLHADGAAEGDGLVVGGGALDAREAGAQPRRARPATPQAAGGAGRPRSAREQSKVRSLLKRIAGAGRREVHRLHPVPLDRRTRSSRRCASAGIEPAIFHGELGWREKEEALDRFRAAAPVLVSTEAGGEGRNLQFCRIVINYDLPWNPMRVEQRIGRVHRLGQEHPVRVINLVARGTIEAYVLEILDRKIRMFELVVGRDRGDPRHLAAARLVRGRDLPALDRVDESAGAQAPLRRAGAAPGLRAAPVPGAEGSPELAVPRRRPTAAPRQPDDPVTSRAPSGARPAPAGRARTCRGRAGTGPPGARARRGRGAWRRAGGERRAITAPAPAVGAHALDADVARRSSVAGSTAAGARVSDAARGDWEVELSPALQRRWRRQRVRLVFDPQRADAAARRVVHRARAAAPAGKILEAAARAARSRVAPRSRRCRARPRTGSPRCAGCAD